MNDQNDDKMPTHDLLTKGTMVAHYRVIEKIGAGGMGEVYLSEDTKLKRRVALKFLSVGQTHDESVVQQFMHEAQAAARLQHPNIITVHEVNESRGAPFISMEYVEGHSLADIADH
jgi:serine/threonine protein kinase